MCWPNVAVTAGCPGKTGEHSPAGEVVEHGQVLGQLEQVDHGEVHPGLSHRIRSVLGDEVVPEERVGGDLDILDLAVLLGMAKPS